MVAGSWQLLQPMVSSISLMASLPRKVFTSLLQKASPYLPTHSIILGVLQFQQVAGRPPFSP